MRCGATAPVAPQRLTFGKIFRQCRPRSKFATSKSATASCRRSRGSTSTSYSIHSLPPFWQKLSHLNPFFYMIDGFRYGFFGASDFPPLASLAVVGLSLLGLTAATLWLLKSGYKLRG